MLDDPLRESMLHGRELSEGGILSGYSAMHDVFSRWLVQVVIIMVTCRVLAILGQYMHQPRVIFEIIAGILLGPSAIGRSDANNSTYNLKVFPKASLGYLQIVASIGLTLYLFLVGMELDPELIKSHYRKAGAIAVVGMIVPFCLGIAISGTMFTTLNSYGVYANVNYTSFYVFIGTAMSITAFPVLARILKEGGLMYTKAGAMVMGAAALNDALAWILLTLAISIAQAGNLAVAGYVFLSVVTFALGLWLIVRPVFARLVEYTENMHDPKMDNNLFALTLILVFLSAWTTQLLGVHAIFGSFLFGLIVPRNSHLFKECNEKIEELVLTVTLPIYFALSGIKTDVTTISSKEEGAMVVLVCFVATVGKFIGCGFTARVGGMTNRESVVVAILMNTRGLVELIVLNLGMDAGILSIKTFSVMVIMCLFTTFITSPLVDYFYPYEVRQQDLKDQRDADVSTLRKLKTHTETGKDEDLEAEPRDEADYRLETAATNIRITIVIDCLEHMQGFLDLTYHLMPLAAGSSLSALLLKFNEPSYTMKDQFLGLTPDGRLILVEPEVTDLAESLTLSAAAKRPQLLPLSMQLKSIKVSQVRAFNVIGDPDEYPSELCTLTGRDNSDFIFFPWRPSMYTQTFFNAALLVSEKPIALVAQVNVAVQTVPEGLASTGTLYAPKVGKPRSSTADTSGSEDKCPVSSVRFESAIQRSQKEILVLVTGKAVDLSILPLVLRFAENASTRVTVLVPQDRRTFAQKNREFFHDFKAKAKSMPNISIEIVSAISTDTKGLISCILSSTFDTFISAFVPCQSLLSPQQSPMSEDAESGNRDLFNSSSMRQRSKSITELDNAVEELGSYGSAIYAKQTVSTLIIFHEERSSFTRSRSTSHQRRKSDASDEAMRHVVLEARDSVDIEMVAIKD